MSTIDVGLLLNGVGHGRAGADGSSSAPLRVVLVEGEALKLPPGSTGLRVLTGAAWVSQAARDSFPKAGELFHPADDADAAVISPLGDAPLLVEIH